MSGRDLTRGGDAGDGAGPPKARQPEGSVRDSAGTSTHH